MFKKSFSPKNSFLLAALFALFEFASTARAADSACDKETKLKWLKDLNKSRPSVSNIVVLGPKNNGKSTLINLLIHTSDYATREKSGHVLVDFESKMDPIYHRDIFRSDSTKPIDMKNFRETHLPNELKVLPSIDAFMPVLGPIPVKDFLKKFSQTSLLDHETEGEKMEGGTEHPHVYRSNSKVTSPVFRSTFVDAPGIGTGGRLTFVESVIEELPSDKIHALLLVVSSEQFLAYTSKKDAFAYFKEVAEFLKHVDPTFSRVQLAVTHAGSKEFQRQFNSHDPRRVVAEQFLQATGILVSTSKVFFFENQYNCLSEDAMDSLYACQTGADADSDIQRAFQHRQKNYQLNLLESFNLLKNAAKTNPVSRNEILKQIRATLGVGQQAKKYVIGRSYANGTPTMASSASGFSVSRGTLTLYQTLDGSWWLKGHAYITTKNQGGGPHSIVITLSGVKFKNSPVFYQHVDSLSTTPGSTLGKSYVYPNTGNIVIGWPEGQTSFQDNNFSFDVELDEKPSWADNY